MTALVSVPPHAVRTYTVSRDISLNWFYLTWRVFIDGLKTAISLERLLAPILGMRYRKIVTWCSNNLTYSGLSSSKLLAWSITGFLIFLNSSLNPLLYCWKITEVRQADRRQGDNPRSTFVSLELDCCLNCERKIVPLSCLCWGKPSLVLVTFNRVLTWSLHYYSLSLNYWARLCASVDYENKKLIFSHNTQSRFHLLLI